jgi:hypothetical protein
MAQLGDLVRAKALLRRAARARCIVVVDVEIALASRDLGWSARALEAHGDHFNAAHASYLEIRRLLLIGRIGVGECRSAGAIPLAGGSRGAKRGASRLKPSE